MKNRWKLIFTTWEVFIVLESLADCFVTQHNALRHHQSWQFLHTHQATANRRMASDEVCFICQKNKKKIEKNVLSLKRRIYGQASDARELTRHIKNNKKNTRFVTLAFLMIFTSFQSSFYSASVPRVTHRCAKDGTDNKWVFTSLLAFKRLEIIFTIRRKKTKKKNKLKLRENTVRKCCQVWEMI